MIRAGLCSGSLSEWGVEEIAELAARSGLHAIEWHTSHVPPGEVALAQEVRELTLDWGLQVAAYDSGHRLGKGGFASVLNTAVFLGAASVGVCVGEGSFAGTSDECRAVLCDELRSACELARRAGVAVAVKTHGGTLVDGHRARLWLRSQLAHPNLRFDWSPSSGSVPSQDDRRELNEILPCLGNVLLDHECDTSAWTGLLRSSSRRRFVLLRSHGGDVRTVRQLAETIDRAKPVQLTAVAIR